MLHERADVIGSGTTRPSSVGTDNRIRTRSAPPPARRGPDGSTGERRRHARRTRLSWASDVPFVLPEDRPHPTPPRRTWASRYRLTVATVDALTAVLVLGVTGLTLPWPQVATVILVAVGTVAWPGAVALFRGYDRRALGSGPQEYQALLRAGLAVGVLVSIVSYATRTELPRRIVLVGLPLLVLASALGHFVARRRLHGLRRHGHAMLRTLIVGGVRDVDTVAETLRRAPHDGHHLVGRCGPPGENPGDERLPKLLGAVGDIPQVVVDESVDVVLVAGGYLSGEGLRRLTWALEHTGADLVVEPGLVEVLGPRLTMRATSGLSLLHVDSVHGRRGQAVTKRVMDVILGSGLLLLSVPVVLVAAAMIKVLDGGPVFFTQQRVGQEGRRFTMYKLRTMCVDAEARRAEIEQLSDRDGLMFKMRRDPRLIRGGAFLRRFSLDELPQLLNVVRGDMSLVGPRPPLVAEHDLYHDRIFRRLRVRPGLTGLWQVSGRADLTWEEAIRLDLRYVDNWSVTMDLFILWKTARAALGGSGAY